MHTRSGTSSWATEAWSGMVDVYGARCVSVLVELLSGLLYKEVENICYNLCEILNDC